MIVRIEGGLPPMNPFGQRIATGSAKSTLRQTKRRVEGQMIRKMVMLSHWL